MSRKKKFLKAIYDNGKGLDFIEFLLRINSACVNTYAQVFCKKEHIKVFDKMPGDEKAQLEEDIRIAKTPWLDDFDSED